MLLEHQGLFNALDLIPPRSYLDGAPLQSLDDLIESGIFLRTNRQNFRRSNFFNPRQKAALALKLAYSLMDFFDMESITPSWDGKKMFLASPPGSRTQDGLLYISFARGVVRSPGPILGSVTQSC